MLPHRRTNTMLVGLLAVDLPILLAVVAFGFWFGFANTYWAIMDWRLAHPVSLLPSLILAVWLARKWWKA